MSVCLCICLSLCLSVQQAAVHCGTVLCRSPQLTKTCRKVLVLLFICLSAPTSQYTVFMCMLSVNWFVIFAKLSWMIWSIFFYFFWMLSFITCEPVMWAKVAVVFIGVCVCVCVCLHSRSEKLQIRTWCNWVEYCVKSGTHYPCSRLMFLMPVNTRCEHGLCLSPMISQVSLQRKSVYVILIAKKQTK